MFGMLYVNLHNYKLSQLLGIPVIVTQRERFHGRGTHVAEGGIGKDDVDEAVPAKVNIRVPTKRFEKYFRKWILVGF